MNSIEHLWDIIGCGMKLGPLAQTVDDLISAVEVDCQRLTQATINGLSDRIPQQIGECTVVQGGHIRY
ncbi:hypothetical protein TNCV_2642641 [Trichonephila clavipes]|nr:hypothetical protein TNCV_2642641 [Trichonephila clavipes]